ncbi:MAG: glycerol-3-phosphate 1-O-acyltransferase PlsB [Burkholderiales bacterium]|nr:glycerol-3-phosphate 1-O-acyltransferase PlsB [Burkholderiales bacterium]
MSDPPNPPPARARRLRPGNVLLALLRRLLYLVIRTNVTPERADALGVDAGAPLAYVIEDRHLSSLLVLEQEAQRLGLPSALDPVGPQFARVDRAVFSVILNRNPLSTRTDEPSATLARLVQAVLGDAALDVQLVPVAVLWGRAPKAQESLLRALFADAWASVGPLRQIAIILLHGRQTRVTFAEPISLRRLIDAETDVATAVRKANRFLRFHFRRQRESAIGPDLSHRRNLIDAMIRSEPLRQAIGDEARRLSIGLDPAERRARRFAWEIASDFSYPVVRSLELVLKRLWERLYDEVAIHHAKEVARVAPGKGLVYLPNHRSHVDYLLLSYFINAAGLAPPHIAAGANLNFPLVGPVLRRGGAFFLRRSFKGEPLYAAVFREYLHTMLVRGFPIAYFVEGGRSRSGRTLSPKGGLLGMTLESFMREHPRPVLLVPIWFGYEKLLEGRSLLAELEGKPKRGESLGDLVRVTRQLKRVYGRVDVNFGDPLSLDHYLDAAAPGWHALEGDARREAAKRLTAALSREMAERINAAVVVNAINLYAMAIAGSPRYALDERALAQQIEWLRALAQRVPYSEQTVLVAGDPAAVIAEALKLGFGARVAHPLGDVIKVPDAEVSALNYLRNNVLHAYALPALVASLLVGTRETTAEGVAEFAAAAQPFARAELMLRRSPEEAAAQARDILALFIELGLARQLPDGAVRAADRYSAEHAGLDLLARSIRHLLRRNYLTIALLTQVGSGQMTRERLDELMGMLTQRLSLLFEFAPPDFYERATFASYVDSLIDNGIVAEDEGGRLHLDERARAWTRNVERLLPADAVLAIRRVAVAHAPTEAPAPGASS